MTKKTYEKPTLQVVKIAQQQMICTSKTTYGVNQTIQTDEVDEGW